MIARRCMIYIANICGALITLSHFVEGFQPLSLLATPQPKQDGHLLQSPSNLSNDAPLIIFPGGGVFFYWQAGVVSYLKQNGYDLSECRFAGASAGALTATLVSADADFYTATDLALEMSAKAGVWDRGSLQGIWGSIIEDWLRKLLADTSLSSVNGRLSLLVTPIPSFGKTRVSHFHDVEDLVACNMASVHLVSTVQHSSLSFLNGLAFEYGISMYRLILNLFHANCSLGF